MSKFSIVVPCYNSFEHMHNCLESLKSQTFNDFEIIFIDDCSQDDTYLQLEEYLNKSNFNYKLLKNDENLGAGLTRNVGIENATGKYVMFVDADDYIQSNTLELLEYIIVENKVECIFFDYYYETNRNKIYYNTILGGIEGIISKSDALVYSTGSTCCKVYLLENIKQNNIKFPNLKRNEDFVFNKIAVANSNSFYYLKKPLYSYVDYATSLMHNKELLNENNAIKGFEIVENLLKYDYPKEIEEIFIKEYFYSVTVTLIEKNRNKREIKQHIENCERKYPNFYRNESICRLSKFQRYFIKLAKLKIIFLLKILIGIKQIIKKIR